MDSTPATKAPATKPPTPARQRRPQATPPKTPPKTPTPSTQRNGWRDGSDPALRWLRAITVASLLATVVWLAIDPSRDSTDVAVIGMLLGVILVALQFRAATIKWPPGGDKP